MVFTKILNEKKLPCIPPIIHDHKFVADFCKKAISLILLL